MKFHLNFLFRKEFPDRLSRSAFHFSEKFKSGEGNVGRKVGTTSDLTAPLLPAEMFLGQVPICLRRLEGLFLQVGWPIISSGTSLLSISADVKGVLSETCFLILPPLVLLSPLDGSRNLYQLCGDHLSDP